MKRSKRFLCAAVAVALTLGVSGAAFSGCIATVNEEDVKQVIAHVDITGSEAFSKEFGDYASAVAPDDITKRDLILTYINVGSSSGASFSDLADSLAQNAIVTQYSTAALLKDKVENGTGYSVAQFKALTDEAERYEYILGGSDSEQVNKAKYALYKLLNNSLDSNEKAYIKNDDKYTGSDTRFAPNAVDTEKDDYYPQNAAGKLDYGVYTGYEGYLLSQAGQYEELDGSTRNTRRRAYSSLISYLKANYLISAEDKNTTDILELSYVKQTYINYLKSQIISEYGKLFEKQFCIALDKKDDEGVYTYIKEQYDGATDGELTKQQKLYSEKSEFNTAMSGLSDTSFILYSPDTSADTIYDESTGKYGTFGYVYNILLPFSAMQNSSLEALKSRLSSKNIDDEQYFYARNQLLGEIITTDQRAAWFNGSSVYAFDADEYVKNCAEKGVTPTITDWYGKNAGKNYLFFENNMTDTNRYKEMEKYIGLYAYNGAVVENKDGSYKLMPDFLDIDGMLYQLTEYVNYVLGGDKVTIAAGDTMAGAAKWTASSTNSAYYTVKDFYKSGSTKKIDYSKLVYATGKVDFGDVKSDDLFALTKDGNDKYTVHNDRYKAMAAVNELQYAYTTDTSVLNQYIGYTVSAYTTSYIKEFEYAAQQALRMGAGAFKVCAGDYGWHIIYVTETYTFGTDGEVYSPSWTEDRITREGTFENRFYNWIKDSAVSNEVNKRQSRILKTYNGEATVTMYKDAYKDLAGLN